MFKDSTALDEDLVVGGVARKRVAGCHTAADCAVDVDEVAGGFTIAVPAAVDAAADRAAAFYPHAVLGGAARIAVVVALGHTAVDVAINPAAIGNSDFVPSCIADARAITAEYRAIDNRALREADGIIYDVAVSGIAGEAVFKSASVDTAFDSAGGDIHGVIFNRACWRVQEYATADHIVTDGGVVEIHGIILDCPQTFRDHAAIESPFHTAAG